jgi:hypothetical protein
MSLKDKITLAYHLHANYVQALLQDKKIQAMIIQLDERIEATWREMALIGVVRECTDCALNGGGSCCGSGMEKMYDETVLLINLLLGKTITIQEYDPNSCSFLSERGCTLRAREVICVNYLCDRIYKSVGREKLIHLQRIAGKELKTLFVLEESIKKKISKLKGLNHVTEYEVCRTY